MTRPITKKEFRAAYAETREGMCAEEVARFYGDAVQEAAWTSYVAMHRNGSMPLPCACHDARTAREGIRRLLAGDTPPCDGWLSKWWASGH